MSAPCPRAACDNDGVFTFRQVVCCRRTWATAGLVLAFLIWLATIALAVALIADDTPALGIPMIVVTCGVALGVKAAHASWTVGLLAGAGVTLFLLYAFISLTYYY